MKIVVMLQNRYYCYFVMLRSVRNHIEESFVGFDYVQFLAKEYFNEHHVFVKKVNYLVFQNADVFRKCQTLWYKFENLRAWLWNVHNLTTARCLGMSNSFFSQIIQQTDPTVVYLSNNLQWRWLTLKNCLHVAVKPF